MLINSTAVNEKIKNLTEQYPFINITEIGKSRKGNPIHSLTMGGGKRKVMFNASHHANEWITTAVLLRFIEECAQSIEKCNSTLHFVPLVNPDGVDYSINGNPEWKANIAGIDLNSNYPAGWEQARKFKFSKGYTQPGARDYVGPTPLSEPETQAMAAYTKAHNFDLTLSLHTQGEVIYWRYMDYMPPGAEELAERFSKASGYELEDVPDYSSHAGYRDWFIAEFNKPGFTIECGYGENPLPIEDFEDIYKKTAPLLWEAVFS